VALRAAFIAAENKKSKEEVLKFITVVFCVAGSPAPAKLAFTVIDRLWTDKETNVPLFKKNPHNFIKECARLDKVVPTVNVLATNEIANEIENSFKNKNKNITIPENTPIHCSIVNANRDETIFQNPDQFLPDRSDLNKLIVWNGVEEDIINPDKSKRPIRYCPGHDLAIDLIQYVAERFLPIISDTDEQRTITTEQTGQLSNFCETLTERSVLNPLPQDDCNLHLSKELPFSTSWLEPVGSNSFWTHILITLLIVSRNIFLCLHLVIALEIDYEFLLFC
jgi:cytochrome P450